MKLKEVEIEIKRGDPSILEAAGILHRAAKSGYICLECGSGSGDKGTGTENFVTNKGYTVQKCFHCGKSFNNLELIARAYNLHIDDGGKDYYEAVRIGSQLFGIELDNSDFHGDNNHPLPKMEFEPPKVYSPAEIVADSTKNAVNSSAFGLSDKPNAIFSFQPLRRKGFEWLFAGAVPIVQDGKEDNQTMWRCLANSDEYDLKENCKYTTRFLYARYFKMPAGGDVPEEFALYKKICAELKIPFKTKAQEKAEYDAKVAELVRADIDAAIANIDNAPVEVRRGLSIDILKELRFGWLEQWIHPAVRIRGNKAYPTRRLLACTPNHYEAMIPKIDRDNSDSRYWKMHTSPREPYYLDIIPFGNINLIFEGAVDAASAYYALDKKIPCYATGGTGEYKIFVDALNKACKNDIVKPRFVIMFDSDDAGRKVAPEFQQLMRKNGYPCAIRFLADGVSKIDANDILVQEGKEALAAKIKSCLDGIDSDLTTVEIKTVEETPADKTDSPAIKRKNRYALPGENKLKELYKLPQSDERDDEIINTIIDNLEWTLNKKGGRVKVKPTAQNFNLIFTYDPYLNGLFGYNQFSCADVLLKDAPWQGIEDGAEWNSYHESALRCYLRDTYGDLHNREMVDDYFSVYSHKRKFHPIKQWLENLPKWDGIPRAENFFIDYLKATDSVYTRTITRTWLLGALSRVYNPGCDFQYCLILGGKQGIGKSTCLKMLGGEWAMELQDKVDDSHAVDAIRRGWIVEIAEFAAMKKADIASIKSFLSITHDVRRFSYGRRAERVPRSCVFAATTNDTQILRDETGSRRFWILECHEKFNTHERELTQESIKQVWAEALTWYKDLFKDGFNAAKLTLPTEIKIEAEKIATSFKADDGLAGEVSAFLDTLVPAEPVWNLLTKKERRSFIENRILTLPDGELETRWKIEHRRPSKTDREEFEAAVDFVNSNRHKAKVYGEDCLVVDIRGTVQRTHISAVEVFNECFGSDRRKSMNRITEILTHLDGWLKGKRIQNDKVYGDQRNVYYRQDVEPVETPPVDDNPTGTDNDDADNGDNVIVNSSVVNRTPMSGKPPVNEDYEEHDAFDDGDVEGEDENLPF